MGVRLSIQVIPAALAVVGAALVLHWVSAVPQIAGMEVRVPGMDHVPAASTTAPAADLRGTFTKGDGVAATDLPGAWPRFRGAKIDGINDEPVPLARKWKGGGPTKLWGLDAGEGYAGAAVLAGRVYLLDYDQNLRQDVLRCLSLADGREIWRRAYANDITRNHGLSRTVPAVTEKYVVTMGPRCHVLCADAVTGDFVWGMDLVRDFKVTVPQWYAGQCPLIDGDRAILATGGPSALLVAVDLATGKVAWQSPNPRKWEMTHSSVVPVTVLGKRMYVYCGTGGVAGISADDGSILWDSTEWKVTMANVPSPLPIGDGRIFLSGGYGAGSMMIRLEQEGSRIVPRTLFRLKPDVFGAEQHTPILYGGHLYAIAAPSGQMVCLSLEGKRIWSSGPKEKFGLGPFMIADGLIIAMDDGGTLSLVEATPTQFRLVARASVFADAHEAWGPFALVGGRLIARDMHHIACLDLRKVAHE